MATQATTQTPRYERCVSNGMWVALEESELETILDKAFVIAQRIAVNLKQEPPANIDALRAQLESGKKIKYGTDWYEQVRRTRPPAPPIETVHADCGHQVRKGQLMNASLGTACSDCYDRMSN